MSTPFSHFVKIFLQIFHQQLGLDTDDFDFTLADLVKQGGFRPRVRAENAVLFVLHIKQAEIATLHIKLHYFVLLFFTVISITDRVSKKLDSKQSNFGI